VAAEEMFGSPLLQSIPDIDHAECVIMVGTNPAVSQLSFANVPRVMERLKAVARRPNGRVVFVNPRRTESAQQVGEHLPIRPGSDVYFFLAFAHVIFAEERVSQTAAAVTIGLEQLREVVRPWTPERVAPLTGIDATTLRKLVADYCKAEGAVLYAGTGVNQGAHGTLALWMLTAIQVLAGQLDRKGSAIVTRQQIRTARFGYPANDGIAHHKSRFSDHPSVIDSLPAGLLADEILGPGEGQLKALFVSAGNPLLSCPNSARLREALSQLPLLVCIDLFRNETGNLAHYILPVTSFLERSDFPMGMSGYQPVPYAQYVEPVVEPLGECRDEWWVFTQLGRVCAAPLNRSSLVQWWFNESVKERSWLPRWLHFTPKLILLGMLLFEFLLPQKLRKHPHGLLLAPHRGQVFLGRNVLTKHRKVQLAPARFVAAAGQLEQDFASQLAGRDRLMLITKREKKSHNSWMHNAPSLGGDTQRSQQCLYMNPEDASARGILDGEICEVRSSTGTVRIPVHVSDDVMVKTVALPHGWGHAEAEGLKVARTTPGVNANLLSPDGANALDSLSGMSRLTALEVDLGKLTPP
jgi:anaerobic selenocysteine-containing dehydrogenase